MQINYILSFEEITLKFITVNEQVLAKLFFASSVCFDLVLNSYIYGLFLFHFACLQDALRTFLLRKLDSLAKDDKCQITMISTWATELYLDKVLLLSLLSSWIKNYLSFSFLSYVR